MARREELGETDVFSTSEPCEAGNCNERTQAAIWDGERYRYLCDEHRDVVGEQLRETGGMSAADLV
jgi:hypothetical protein